MDWPVLASVPADDRDRLVARLRRLAYRRDEVIFHQGDPADTLHLVAAGHVSVRVTLPGGEFVIVAIFGPGDAFGELALVGGPRPRGATVIALDGSTMPRPSTPAGKPPTLPISPCSPVTPGSPLRKRRMSSR